LLQEQIEGLHFLHIVGGAKCDGIAWGESEKRKRGGKREEERGKENEA